MKQLFYHYKFWEDHKNGFYGSFSGDKNKAIKDIVCFFSNKHETEKYMSLVTKKWIFSCRHNLTNNSINKVAYLGQSAVNLKFGYPSTITMEAWSSVPKEFQNIANNIANKIIKTWTKSHCQNQTAQIKIIFQ